MGIATVALIVQLLNIGNSSRTEECQDGNVFQTVFNNARETGMFPSVRIASEKQAGAGLTVEEEIRNMVERSSGVSTRHIAIRLQINQATAWEVIQKNGLKSFHIQRVQNLQDSDNDLRLHFCNWMNTNHTLYKYILVTRDGVNKCHIVGQMKIRTP